MRHVSLSSCIHFPPCHASLQAQNPKTEEDGERIIASPFPDSLPVRSVQMCKSEEMEDAQ